jgi:hypothetical protein
MSLTFAVADKAPTEGLSYKTLNPSNGLSFAGRPTYVTAGRAGKLISEENTFLTLRIAAQLRYRRASQLVPFVPMTMRHRRLGRSLMRAQGKTSTWLWPARHPKSPCRQWL